MQLQCDASGVVGSGKWEVGSGSGRVERVHLAWHLADRTLARTPEHSVMTVLCIRVYENLYGMQ